MNLTLLFVNTLSCTVADESANEYYCSVACKSIMHLTKKQLLNAEKELIRRLDNPDYDDLGLFICKASKEEFVAFSNKEEHVPVRLVFRQGDVFAVDYGARIHGRVASKRFFA